MKLAKLILPKMLIIRFFKHINSKYNSYFSVVEKEKNGFILFHFNT